MRPGVTRLTLPRVILRGKARRGVCISHQHLGWHERANETTQTPARHGRPVSFWLRIGTDSSEMVRQRHDDDAQHGHSNKRGTTRIVAKGTHKQRPQPLFFYIKVTQPNLCHYRCLSPLVPSPISPARQGSTAGAPFLTTRNKLFLLKCCAIRLLGRPSRASITVIGTGRCSHQGLVDLRISTRGCGSPSPLCGPLMSSYDGNLGASLSFLRIVIAHHTAA